MSVGEPPNCATCTRGAVYGGPTWDQILADPYGRKIAQMIEENETLRSMLREFVTPPLSYGKKKELVERTRLLIEGWE